MRIRLKRLCERVTWLSLMACMLLQIVNSVGIQSRLRQETLNVSQNVVSLARGITIQESDLKKDSVMKFLTLETNYVQFLLQAETGAFLVNHSGIQILEIFEGLFTIEVDTKLRSLHFEQDIFSGTNQKQWKLFAMDIDNPHSEPRGWSDNSSSTCGNIYMLGGYNNFAKGEVKKTFTGVPVHSQVRIIAHYHFIDQWLGEVAFLKINSHLADLSRLEYVWTYKFDTAKLNSLNPINVCGGEYPEYQLNTLIDVTIPHNKDTIILAFGSTLETEDPSEASFGISDIQIYLK